jgi:hypothetical protein
MLQLERLEMYMNDFSIMVKELGDSEGVVVSSTPRGAQDQISHAPSPHGTSELELELEEIYMEIDS